MAFNYAREFAGMPPLPKQPMTNVGELKCQYTGEVFGEATVNAYNRYTKDFNNTRYRDHQEFLLDQRHKFIHAIMLENRKNTAA